MTKTIVDSHVHVCPDFLEGRNLLEGARTRVRTFFGPPHAIAQDLAHRAQTWVRHLPPVIKILADESGSLLIPAGLVMEATPRYLDVALSQSGATHALIVATPPFVGADFVFNVCEKHNRLAGENSNWAPVATIPRHTNYPARDLRRLIRRGARALKLHPAFDGEGPESTRYRSLLREADLQGLPVILNTGCIRMGVFYRDPKLGRAELYRPWFEKFKNVRFVVAHMNFHEPDIAFDLAETYSNIWLDTSWQPSETIGEATRRLGAERILLASDWPFLGGNLRTALARIAKCVSAGTLTDTQADQIRGENALDLFWSRRVGVAKRDLPSALIPPGKRASEVSTRNLRSV